MTLHFYRDVDALESFALALATDRHVPVPRDWWIVVADVVVSLPQPEAKKGGAMIYVVIAVVLLAGAGAAAAWFGGFIPH